MAFFYSHFLFIPDCTLIRINPNPTDCKVVGDKNIAIPMGALAALTKIDEIIKDKEEKTTRF